MPNLSQEFLGMSLCGIFEQAAWIAFVAPVEIKLKRMKQKIYEPVREFERQTSYCPLYLAWRIVQSSPRFDPAGDEARDYFRTSWVPSPGSGTRKRHLIRPADTFSPSDAEKPGGAAAPPCHKTVGLTCRPKAGQALKTILRRNNQIKPGRDVGWTIRKGNRIGPKLSARQHCPLVQGQRQIARGQHPVFLSGLTGET